MKRQIIRLVAGLLLLASVPALYSLKKPYPPHPNIIFILADDLGYGDLGCYGQQLIHTPHLDAMAHEGMRFTRFYAGTAVCAPSRSSLLTGQHTGHTPIRGNKPTPPEGQWPIPDSAFTMAEMLKKAGYATGDFGKWGLGFVGTSGDPIRQGFDEFYGYNCQTRAHDYFPDHLWFNDKRISFPQNKPNDPVDYSAPLIQQKALAFIDQHRKQPFFLYLSYTLPHAALQVPDDSLFEYYKHKFHEKPVPVKLPWNGRGYAPQPYPRAAYATMVTRLDNYVQQILDKLHHLGLSKNTLIIFTSDNGPHAEGGNDPYYFNSNGGLRGIKRDLYEGGIREPTIAYWPGTIKAGTVSGYIGAFWDFMPTFAQLTGQPRPPHIDGLSILPTLLSEKPQPEHDYLYWEFHEQGGKQAVRMGKWKGVRLKVMLNPDAPIELYDLDKDPSEKNNIAAQHPDIVQKINGIMKKAHWENEVFPFWTTHK